jgi:hypothetical protein
LKNAKHSWEHYRKTINRGFSCLSSATFEVSSNKGISWSLVPTTSGQVAIGQQGELYFDSDGKCSLLNDLYHSEIRRLNNDQYVLERCEPRSNYQFVGDLHLHRPVLHIFQSLLVENILIQNFLASEKVTILRSDWKDDSHSILELELDCTDFELNEFNRISGIGTISLLPEHHWLINDYRLPLQSVLNFNDVREKQSAKNWSEVCWVIRTHEYDFGQQITVPKKQVTLYQPAHPYDWRKNTEEFRESDFAVDERQFFNSYYGLQEPPYGSRSYVTNWLWPLLMIFVALSIGFFFAETDDCPTQMTF